jgi:hypothetical protein
MRLRFDSCIKLKKAKCCQEVASRFSQSGNFPDCVGAPFWGDGLNISQYDTFFLHLFGKSGTKVAVCGMSKLGDSLIRGWRCWWLAAAGGGHFLARNRCHDKEETSG